MSKVPSATRLNAPQNVGYKSNDSEIRDDEVSSQDGSFSERIKPNKQVSPSGVYTEEIEELVNPEFAIKIRSVRAQIAREQQTKVSASELAISLQNQLRMQKYRDLATKLRMLQGAASIFDDAIEIIEDLALGHELLSKRVVGKGETDE